VDEQPARRRGPPREGPVEEPERVVDLGDLDPGPPGSAGLAPGLPGRSPHLATCPFFRSALVDGTLGPPLEAPDPINRCAAFGEPKPQSYRQQELVCLTSGHVTCPRYLRGAAVARPASRRIRRIHPIPAPGLGRATGAATVLLAAAVVASVGFVFARGGLSLPRATPTPAVAAATQSPIATPTGSPPPSVEPTATPSPSAAAIASPSVSPSPSATLPPTPSKTPRSDRYDLLDPCPDRPRCWIYTIRSGDNLSSIANYFGIPLDTVRDLNPWTRTQGLRTGQELILPPPTR
jgi:LysM domain-containing protein